jgi:hypothetical protein
VIGKLLHRTQSCRADASFPQPATTVGDFDLAPGPVHVKEDEQVGGLVALVFAVVAFKLARFGRDRRPDLADQLGRALIETNDRMLGSGPRRRDRALPPDGRTGAGRGRDDSGRAAVRSNYAGRADDVVCIVLEGPETSLLLTSLPAANFH